MPAAIGARETHTQDRIIHLFQHTLGYQYLGNWKDRPDNRPIEETLLTRFLQKQGIPPPSFPAPSTNCKP